MEAVIEAEEIGKCAGRPSPSPGSDEVERRHANHPAQPLPEREFAKRAGLRHIEQTLFPGIRES
jgi:hypothetical protein